MKTLEFAPYGQTNGRHTSGRPSAFQKMGRLRFELRTNRLKAECSTAELATR